MAIGTDSREQSIRADSFMQQEAQPSGISVDALLLAGMLQCRGSVTVKSTCLQMMAQPYLETIGIGNKDLKAAFCFLIILATVIEDMSNDI